MAFPGIAVAAVCRGGGSMVADVLAVTMRGLTRAVQLLRCVCGLLGLWGGIRERLCACA